MKTEELRRKFLEFFEREGHSVLPSSSLVPDNDPTLLFTNAGMVQFKDVFTGKKQVAYRRATTSQKCVRAGGKHNDLENVGFTARHHTFFEMLGNFSFGDYFKHDAILFAWKFLTEIVHLDADKLWVTVFREDDEAAKMWHELVGVSTSRIIRRDEKDNFWSMGDTGPCGPCSEILFDQGPETGCRQPDCNVNCPRDCDRYLEIWNLVFMQFNRHADGKMEKLPNPSIDTGMGLERLAAVVQKVKSNYEIDLIRGLLDLGAKLANTTYGKNSDADASLRVIADHARATTFLICDGVLPSNEGAGYVLRRIMRRAIRHGRKLGLEKPFLHEICLGVVKAMGGAYPDLHSKQEYLQKTVRLEEERFAETLDHGLQVLEESFRSLAKGGSVPGDVLFRLYDTFGFPLDLTRVIARERGLDVDEGGFEKEMSQQRQRSQQAGKGLGKSTESAPALDLRGLERTTCEFIGYNRLRGSSRVTKILPVDGKHSVIVLAQTPFYAESGGQVGDTGLITSPDGAQFQVSNTTKTPEGLFLHHGTFLGMPFREGQDVELAVDETRRRALVLNHSATHLLHAALRTVLGKHVHQKGSLVAPDRLRFDFTHFEAVDPSALRDIEDLCNEHVRLNHAVQTEVMAYQQALQTGAMALFGEKYGDRVRVVRMSPFSVELCGGTHVGATGEIGLLRLRSEAGVASGVRRIEALTGQPALDYVRTHQEHLTRVAERLKTGASLAEIEARIEKLVSQQKALEDQIAKSQVKAVSLPDLLQQAKTVHGVKVLTCRLDQLDAKELRDQADRLRSALESGIVAIGSAKDGKAAILVAVSKDLTNRFKAGDLIKKMVPHVDGSGGGRPDFAQAGGPKVEGLDQALSALEGLLS